MYDSMCMNMPLCESICVCISMFISVVIITFLSFFTGGRKLRARDRYTEEFFRVNEETQLCESWKGNNNKNNKYL